MYRLTSCEKNYSKLKFLFHFSVLKITIYWYIFTCMRRHMISCLPNSSYENPWQQNRNQIQIQNWLAVISFKLYNFLAKRDYIYYAIIFPHYISRLFVYLHKNLLALSLCLNIKKWVIFIPESWLHRYR